MSQAHECGEAAGDLQPEIYIVHHDVGADTWFLWSPLFQRTAKLPNPPTQGEWVAEPHDSGYSYIASTGDDDEVHWSATFFSHKMYKRGPPIKWPQC